MVLAVDIGFGNTKYKTEKKKGIVRTVINRNGITEVGSGKSLQTLDDLIEYSLPVICSIMQKEGISAEKIATGLPLQAFLDLQVRLDLQDRLRKFDKVFVYPQGMSYAIAYGDGLVIDIGHNTVITCVIQNKKLTCEKTYYRKGAIEITGKVYELIKPYLAKVGKTLNNIEIDEIVLNGKYQIGLDIVDLNDEIERIKKEYITDTIKLVINDIKTSSKLLNFDTLYIIGGIAKDVNIQSQKVKIVIPDEPIFANVNAYYDLACMEVEL